MHLDCAELAVTLEIQYKELVGTAPVLRVSAHEVPDYGQYQQHDK